MGLIDFIKDAGKKIFKKEDSAAEAAADAAAAAKAERVRAERLEKFVHEHGLEVENLGIVTAGELVTVSGTAPNQEIREKVVLTLGNTAGTARVDDRMEVKISEPEAQFYTVVSGDSLSKIAKKYYGNAMKYPVISEANKPMLSDPDKIYPGQVLRIPPQE